MNATEHIDDKSTLVQVVAWHCQATTRASVDPDHCGHMASLGHNKLTKKADVSLTTDLEHDGQCGWGEVEALAEVGLWVVAVHVTFDHDCLGCTLLTHQQYSLQGSQ